jgi:hypothetical protein
MITERLRITYLQLRRIALKFTFKAEEDSLKFLLRLRQMIKNSSKKPAHLTQTSLRINAEQRRKIT